MASVAVARAPAHLTGLSANWVEDLLRKEGKSVDQVWSTTFKKDFVQFLKEHEVTKRSDEVTCSSFDWYVIRDLCLSDFRSVIINLENFDTYCEQLRARRWLERWDKLTQTSGTGSTNDQMPPLPAASPFNSASRFLEFYFFKIVTSLKGDVCERIKTLVEGLPDNVMEAAPKMRLTQLTPMEGQMASFELIPIHPRETRSVRNLRAEDSGQLVNLSGVVTRTSDIKPELRFGTFKCTACSKIMESIEQHFKYTEPTFCWHQTCGNRTKWDLKLEGCVFGDWQKIRLQQGVADDMPAGSVPRTLDVIARGTAVERCKPGDQVFLVGTLISTPDVPALIAPRELPKNIAADRNRNLQSEAALTDTGLSGLKKLGVREVAYKQVFLAVNVAVKTEGMGDCPLDEQVSMANETETSALDQMLHNFMSLNTPPTEVSSSSDHKEFFDLLKHPLLRNLKLTYDEHMRFKLIANSMNCLDRLVALVAPEIFGVPDVKKGLLIMLCGGVEKRTRKDHIKLRGDINVCLVGDPGTAKSQLLKFVHGFGERVVFTSGKSSTAAGLTASVHKDAEQGESVVEAGALILADKGVCCIDEFDKMDEKDMVAIHEAMEQQTISISKAGMQATMNARASVLAACNPAEGRYNVTRTLRENLKLSPTILSRFDLIFVLLDRADPETDLLIAEHILRGTNHAQTNDIRGVMLKDQTELKKYCRIAKTFRPRLTSEAKSILVKAYVSLRQKEALPGSARSSRMTVRQLESMLRISEAIAKLCFSDKVLKRHAESAVKIFSHSLSRVKAEQIILNDPLSDDEEDAIAEEIRLDADTYELIQSQMVNHLRDLGDQLLLAGVDSQRKESILAQMTKSQVLTWYLENNLREITSDADVSYERKRLEKVIARMEVNGVLVRESENLDETSKAVFHVHPNFDGGRTARRAKMHSQLHTNIPAESLLQSVTQTDTSLPSASSISDDDLLAYIYGNGNSN